MSKPFDYSKWDNIELSDDEDDVHPNIDRESWFRMKHRSRVEREEREEADKKKIKAEMENANLRMKELKNVLESLEAGEDSDDELEDKEGLEAELESLKSANKARQQKLDNYEKNKKWNVDNMCHVVEERTIVNPRAAEDKFSDSGFALPADEKNTAIDPGTAASKNIDSVATAEIPKKIESEIAQKISRDKNQTVNVASKPTVQTVKPAPAPVKKVSGPSHASISMLSYHDFVEKYADVMEDFMKISSLNESRDFLIKHGDIMLQENASNYLLPASLEDEMNGFREKMRLTARQSQLISNIAELAKTMKTHPGNVINPFFKRLEEKVHYDGFMVGLENFVQNLIKRAVVKRKEIDEERAREEGVDLKDIPKEERLGPGGLDPVEVFESLPASMQEAFESRDTEKLKKALLEMSPQEAEEHMKRCVDAGLWNEG
jgi:Cdc37 Hsp90 binding domain./Cdc37 N terminal kinase binding./Cdc37 C terminal domain.